MALVTGTFQRKSTDLPTNDSTAVVTTGVPTLIFHV